jgi:2-dehydro-3-deoxyphosphogluconate aldolase/(4S)-4-hydroxy-2-oxoglutarate aldolase
MRPGLPDAVVTERILPVARGLDERSAPVLVAALAAGGISSLEITVEGESGFAAIEAAAGTLTTVGAGTIVSISDAARAVDAGARFLVSPHCDEHLVAWAFSNEVPIIPGALTPTEIHAAWRLGPPAVKVFPASLGGAAYIASLRGPYPGVVLLPTGGIDGDSASSYIAAGAVAIGVGGWLTGHEDMNLVTERAGLLRRQVV